MLCKLKVAAAVALAVVFITPRAQSADAKSGLATASAAVARNVVLVHGLFADGSCWSEVIARLQAAGLNATAVQNPLTTLPEAVASVQRVLARQDGPTVLVGHSFAGMIVTEARRCWDCVSGPHGRGRNSGRKNASTHERGP